MNSEDSALSQTREAPGKRRIAVAFASVLVLVAAAAGLWLRTSRTAQPAATAPPEAAHGEEPEKGGSSVIVLDDEAQRNIGLATEVAQIRTVLQTIRTTGIVGANQTRVAHIRPLARGRLEKLHVRVGDRVRAGEPLAAYDNIELGELVSRYLSAGAEVDKATAEAEVARRSVERAQRLIELGALARAEYERREAEYKNTLASINAHKAEAAMIREKLRRFGLSDTDIARLDNPTGRSAHSEALHTTLRAPFDGVVIRSEAAEGELIEPERELFALADLSTVWVQADVHEKDIAAIRQGQQVKVQLNAYPGETFTGRLTYVSDVLDPQTRTAKVRCEVANLKARLKLEMFATVEIPTRAQREALMIPLAAVQQVDQQSAVFVKIDETRFEKREVELGSESDGWVEIKKGLAEGERVVTSGAFMLKSQLKKHELGEDEH